MSNNQDLVLPPELILNICGHVVGRFPTVATRLLVVCRFLRDSLLSTIYRIVQLSARNKVTQLSRAITASHSSHPVCSHTQAIIFSARGPDAGQMSNILDNCSSLKSMSFITAVNYRGLSMEPIMVPLTLESMHYGDMNDLTFALQLPDLQRITLLHCPYSLIPGLPHSNQVALGMEKPTFGSVTDWMFMDISVREFLASSSVTRLVLAIHLACFSSSDERQNHITRILSIPFDQRVVLFGLSTTEDDMEGVPAGLPIEYTTNVKALFGCDYPVIGEEDLWTRAERIRAARERGDLRRTEQSSVGREIGV